MSVCRPQKGRGAPVRISGYARTYAACFGIMFVRSGEFAVCVAMPIMVVRAATAAAANAALATGA